MLNNGPRHKGAWVTSVLNDKNSMDCMYAHLSLARFFISPEIWSTEYYQLKQLYYNTWRETNFYSQVTFSRLPCWASFARNVVQHVVCPSISVPIFYFQFRINAWKANILGVNSFIYTRKKSWHRPGQKNGDFFFQRPTRRPNSRGERPLLDGALRFPVSEKDHKLRQLHRSLFQTD